MTAPAPPPESGTRTSSRRPSSHLLSSLDVQVPGAGEGVLGGGTERDWRVDERGSSGNIGPRGKKREVTGSFKANQNIGR